MLLAAVDLKHCGLIMSAGAALAVRFFSDFSFATIQHEATVSNLGLERLSLSALSALMLNSLIYELQRDWFNLSAQAPSEIAGLVAVLLVAYAALRRALAPTSAAAAILLVAPLVPLLVTAGACTWVLVRAARAA